MRISKRIIFVAAVFFATRLISQSDTLPNMFNGQLGYFDDLHDRIGFQVGLNYSIKNQSILSLKYYQNAEFLVGFPFGDPKVNYIQSIENISILYGYQLGSARIRIIPMAGISFGQGSWRNGIITQTSGNWLFGPSNIYHYDQFRYAGLHINLNLLWAPFKHFGIAADALTNIHQHPDYGLVLSIVVGKLR